MHDSISTDISWSMQVKKTDPSIIYAHFFLLRFLGVLSKQNIQLRLIEITIILAELNMSV